MPEIESEGSRITWNPKNIFYGTAWYYARYRPGYPDEVFDLLWKKFSLNRSSRVLDLGCGTGQIALPIASYVGEVMAVDPQEEMLQEASLLADAKGINNILWLSSESSKLSQIADIGKVDLTVIARAFHWMDRKQTLKDLYTITKPGGGVAIIFDSGPRDGVKLPWKDVIDRVVKHWLGEERKAGTEGTYSHPTERFETILKESVFRNLETAVIQLERKWSIDQIIGYLYSTSSSSLPVLGDKKEPFEIEIRKRLQELEPSGRFIEPVRIEIMMVWKSSEDKYFMKIINFNLQDMDLVRQAAALLVEVFKDTGATSWPDLEAGLKELEEFKQPDHISLAAVDDNKMLLGWIGGIRQYDGNTWELHPLVVRSEYQRRGIGRALVAALEARIRELGGISVFLGTDDENFRTSISGTDLYPNVLEKLSRIKNLNGHPFEFYQKVGFTIVGVIPDANGWGKPDIIMAKRIVKNLNPGQPN